MQAINEKSPELDLEIDSINTRGSRPSIRFTLKHDKQKELVLNAISQEYESRMLSLESRMNGFFRLIADIIDSPREVYNTTV